MSLPSININFREEGISAIQRGERGIVALILEDDSGVGPVEILTPVDIPDVLTEENQDQIKLALIGYQTPPRKVIALTVKKAMEGDVDYTEAQNYLETIRWDYVAVPGIQASATNDFATWIKALRDTKDKKVKAVLPNTAADHEGIINFTTKGIVTESGEFSTAEYCSRIAGLIAGTPLTIATTFAPLPEVIEIESKTKAELDDAISAGEFVLYNDGEKIKVGRGVNSLVTLAGDKQESFKKIKIVEAMDLIYDDVKRTAEDNYLGKFSNSYDNKCLLIVAIQGYFEGLEQDGVLENGTSSVSIDLDRQANYLKSIGVDVETMDEQDIKNANTKDKVFLKSNITILDAIEEITLDIAI